MAEKKEGLPPYSLRLRALREKLGYKRQADLAEALHTKQQTLSRWLNGDARPIPEAFMRMAALVEGEDRIFFLKEGGVLIEDEDDRAIEITVGSGSGESQRLDPDLLAFAIEMTDEQLQKAGKRRENPYYAELIALVYEYCHQEKTRDRDRVRHLFAAGQAAIHLIESGPRSDRTGKIAHQQEDRSHHGRSGTR